MNPQTTTMEEQFKEAAASLPNSTTLMMSCSKGWDGGITLEYSVHFDSGRSSARFQSFAALMAQLADPKEVARKAAMGRVAELQKQIEELKEKIPCA